MEELQLTVEETATTWEYRINHASQHESPERMRSAVRLGISAVNARLSPDGRPIEDRELLCWGKAFVSDLSDIDFANYRDDPHTKYYGLSEGANVIPVVDPITCSTHYTLVHSVSLIPPNSVRQSSQPEITEQAHLLFGDPNFILLDDAKTAFDVETVDVNRSREDVEFLAEQFRASRERGRFDYYSPHKMNEHLKEVINRVEVQIGPKGCGMTIMSQYGYVININRSGKRQYCTDNTLNQQRFATFMGVGDFNSLHLPKSALDYHDLDYELHSGLYMAVALDDEISAAAGLNKQVILVPLQDNRYLYEAL